jgi:cell division protein FtsB
MNGQTNEKARRGRTPGPTERKHVRFRIAYLVVLAVMGLFAYAFLQKTREIHTLSAEQAALVSQNQQIQQSNERMARQNRYYRTKQYEVQAARSIFGFDAPGETAIQVKPVRQPVVTVRRAPPRPLLPPRPVWQQWWDSFFD